MFEEEPAKEKTIDTIGQNLDPWSVGDLEQLILRLKNELHRVEDELSRKRGERSAAESLFKS